MLIRRYGDAVSLIARGERLKQLREQGLTLRADAYGSFTVHPAVATARAAAFAAAPCRSSWVMKKTSLRCRDRTEQF